METIVILIFDDSGGMVGAYADMRRKSRSAGMEDPAPLIERAVKFFGELFPMRRLCANVEKSDEA